MNLQVNMNICRVCMKAGNGKSLKTDLELKTKFVFTTRLTLGENDDMPTLICNRCITCLKIAHDFLKLARASEKNLRAFLNKISSDFQQVTSTDNLFMVTEKDEDVLALINERTEQQFVKPKFGSTKSSSGKDAVLSKTKVVPHLPQSFKSRTVKVEQNKSLERDLKQEHVVEEEKCSQNESFEIYDKVNPLVGRKTEEVDKGEQFNEATTIMELQLDGIRTGNENQSGIDFIDGNLTQKGIQIDDEDQSDNDGYLKEYEALLEDNDGESCGDLIDENIDLCTDGEGLLQEQYGPTQPEVLDDIYPDILEEENVEGRSGPHPVDILPKTDYTFSPNKKLKSRKSLHVSRRTKVKKSTLQTAASLKARFICSKCNRDFSTKTNLTRHMSTHEGVKPFLCKICNRGFTQNGSLKQHMYTHTGERPYECEICGRGFTQCKSLVFHMRRHTGEKPFTCDYCGLFFRQKDGLKTHIMKRHLIKDTDGVGETHTCDICKKVLSTKYTLQVHMKKHVNNHQNVSTMDANADLLMDLMEEINYETSAVDENIVLDIDSISITSSAHVIDEMASSAAEPKRAKKYQCRKCFKCFAIKKNLLRHLTIHISEGPDVFYCKACELSFRNSVMLRLHMENEHKKTTNGCEDCNIVFQTEEELNEHVAVAHILGCEQCPNIAFNSRKLQMEHMLEHDVMHGGS